jgi:hypothetical protein
MTARARGAATAGALAAALVCARAAPAQTTYGSAPIGGRSALMGGTGIALGRDGAAPFLNPATVAHIDASGVAFSVNFYSFQATHLTDFHQPGHVAGGRFGALSLPNASLDTSRADALPSTLCLFLDVGGPANDSGDDKSGAAGSKRADPDDSSARPAHRKGRRKLGACIVTPERMQLGATAQGYSGDSAGLHASQAVSISQFWDRVYVGPSYGLYVSDTVALGASVFTVGSIANSSWAIDTLVSDASARGGASSYDTGASAYSIDLTAALGLVWHIDERQVLGVSVSTPSAHLLGHYQGTTSVQSIDSASSAVLTSSSGSYAAPPPIRVGAGIGMDLGRLRIEADATAYIPVTDLASADVTVQRTALAGGVAQSSSASQSLRVTGRPIVDAAVGFEWFTSPGFSLLGGAGTDLSALDPLAPSPPVGTLAESRTQRATASFGIGSYSDGSELLLGVQLSYAWGKSIAVDPFVSPPELALVDERTFGAMAVVAGGISLSSLNRTLQDLRRLVPIPGVRPR